MEPVQQGNIIELNITQKEALFFFIVPILLDIRFICPNIFFSARIGGILCPYLNMVADYWRPGPLIVYGILAFSAGILSLLLPETLNTTLPDTIEEGEKFGKEEKRCDCISLKKQSHSLTEDQIE